MGETKAAAHTCSKQGGRRDEGSSIQHLSQRCNTRQAAERLALKSLGDADLQEAAGGEITAAPWQRADIHQN